MKYSNGMTIIELIISIAIGLVVSAAAMQLFLTASVNYNLQKNLAELQDNGNFGLNYIIKDIKLANLDAELAIINDRNKYSGIVFTSIKSYESLDESQKESQSANLPLHLTDDTVNILNLSTGGQGLSNVDINSDQLVIQYRAFDPNGVDCEGGSITQDEIDEGTFIIQRYYLRADGDANNLALVCDAGRYKTMVPTASLPTSITGLGVQSQIIMRRVDYFHVLLGVKQNDSDNFRYMTINEYIGANNELVVDGNPRPRIMSIQLGVLTRGFDTVGQANPVVNKFKVLDQDVTLDASDTNYVREVVSQTVALRNGYGLMEEL